MAALQSRWRLPIETAALPPTLPPCLSIQQAFPPLNLNSNGCSVTDIAALHPRCRLVTPAKQPNIFHCCLVTEASSRVLLPWLQNSLLMNRLLYTAKLYNRHCCHLTLMCFSRNSQNGCFITDIAALCSRLGFVFRLLFKIVLKMATCIIRKAAVFTQCGGLFIQNGGLFCTETSVIFNSKWWHLYSKWRANSF